MRKFALVLTLASIFIFVLAGSAFATHFDFNDEPGVNTDRTKLDVNEPTKAITAYNCIECHENETDTRTGPHGGYTTTTDKCMTCHDIHGQAENEVLLRGETVTEACQYCHDLTTSVVGPYYTNGMTTTGAAHRVVGIDVYKYEDTEGTENVSLLEGVTVIPGGSDADGAEGYIDNRTESNITPDFSKQVFTCDSCHTPHGYNTVAPYLGESNVKVSRSGLTGDQTMKFYLTNRLLKQRANHVNDTSFPAVTYYGSRWCAQCHMGQDQFSQDETPGFTQNYHNHPVNETLEGYLYLHFAWNNGVSPNYNGAAGTFDAFKTDVLDGNIITIGATDGEMDTDPRTNKQFAMTDEEVLFDNDGNQLAPVARAQYVAYTVYKTDGPACQQCHGSARDMDLAFNELTNPVRKSFPHISANKGLLTETGDDFCLNCHEIDDLP